MNENDNLSEESMSEESNNNMQDPQPTQNSSVLAVDNKEDSDDEDITERVEVVSIQRRPQFRSTENYRSRFRGSY